MFLSLFKKKENIKIEGACNMCGKCCQNLMLVFKGKVIKRIEQFKQAQEKRPFYKNFKPFFKDEEQGDLYFTCDKLDDNKECGVYRDRPDICKNYPQKHILKHGGKLLPGCGFKIAPKKSFQEVLNEEM